MIHQPLKQCPGCRQWLTLHQILHDRNISPQGILVDPRDRIQCYYQFLHLYDGCLSTFLVHSRTIGETAGITDRFSCPEPAYPCSGFCAEMHELANCRANCSLRHHREFILSLRQQHPGNLLIMAHGEPPMSPSSKH